MPKIVDHEKQRHIVAQAALRVIQKFGLEQATVRNIAKEAGLSVGSMRHYFSTQVELFAFCMGLYAQRVQNRVAELTVEKPFLPDLKQLLLQFLPVNEERTKEIEVWFLFNAKVMIYPELKKVSEEMQNGLYRTAEFVIETLVESNLAKSGLDAALEAEKLYALVDGLAIHQLMQPGRLSPERLEYLLDQHLSSLCIREEESPRLS
ncbi:TetR/AcrR family transcriptional regulator [Paenibacillus elgii]|uniref:TetR family transcriptional regulator n=1 Tax=Paenibacillus elgii TaxID=189691 RepID=A0A161TYC3_9BACL|nr:TetR/AcrR family transcriptional regulator [Paenibacillus elgii]KZE80770.1 TetR family transcriptional regulator [Paenibacillus elgii]MCM3268668.1 TetR family transcriptional regulator [Paenibacillus elgii]NEN83948.1 TetR family transcriptional regulator [Paenibacillus elgii]